MEAAFCIFIQIIEFKGIHRVKDNQQPRICRVQTRDQHHPFESQIYIVICLNKME